MFASLYREFPNIIYIDYSTHTDQGIGLAKLINRNEEMRRISVVGLFDYEHLHVIDRSINSSVRLNHIKCLEIHDVVYDPISLLDVELAEKLDLVQSSVLNTFEIFQPLRIGFIGENHFHVETNSYLPLGEIMEVDHHPLEHIMPSKLVYVQAFHEHGLYFNKRFAYELEFIYKDDDFFVSTNENWKLYKELKKDPKKLEELDPYQKQDVQYDMRRRKEIFAPIKSKIQTWIKNHLPARDPKKLKILVIDESLELFKGVNKLDGEFSYSINFQTHLKEPSKVIFRYTPHLIAFDFNQGSNGIDEFKLMLEAIKEVGADYQPYILAFDLKAEITESLKSLNVPHLLTYQTNIDSQTLLEMAKTLDRKLKISEDVERVFVRSKDKFSQIYVKRNIKVLSMSESIIYFECPEEIPLWTVFKIRSPLKILMTVVPHPKESEFKSPNVYRALINFAGEKQKAEIRRMINTSLMEEEEDS